MTDLYQRTNTDISGETFLTDELQVLGVLDEVEGSGHHRHPELQQTDGRDEGGERQTTERGEAGLLVEHFCPLQTGNRPAASSRLQAAINTRSGWG